MTASKKLIWVDDNPGRASTAKDLGAEFINVHGKDVGPIVETLLRGASPQLVLIDHILDKAAPTTHPAFGKGSTIAEAIKEKWPSCPVVGVTNVDNLAAIDVRTGQTYDALFPFHHFGKYVDRITGIAHGFASAEKARSDWEKLIQLLQPPDDESERLRAALTDDLRQATPDASVASRFYRWVEYLQDRPGFLYDKLWAATFLGLNETGFGKVAGNFQKTQYVGVFARPDEPRWWSNGLSELLYKKCQLKPGELSWHTGRRLPSVGASDFSKCHHCKKDFPETVAFLDESDTLDQSHKERAMHLKCTVLHPRYKRELYFEDVRMMRG